ncbi:MAG: circadian clock protein KaiC [Candidatus Omnitrophota bacterium]
MKTLEKFPTGIAGLDEVLIGGIPKGRSVLVTGETGTGKTVLLNEFIYRGITLFNQNAVFVTFEEKPQDINLNVAIFGWNFATLIKSHKLAFVDVTASKEMLTEIGSEFDVSPLVERIRYAVKKVKAQRVAIDNINALFARFANKDSVRRVLYLIEEALKEMDVTSMISMEVRRDKSNESFYGIEEFVMDGVIELELRQGQQQLIRNLFVRKLRGTSFRSGYVEFEIADHGFIVYPKIPAHLISKKTSFKIRKSTGIRKLDEITGGGVPQGHNILISGNTGTGKTTLGMQFIREGIERGESGIYVCLEEPVLQVEKTAMGHGWDFGKYEKEGKLKFITTSLIDVSNDKLLYQIVNAVNAIGAKRLVFDSISSLMSGTMNEEQVRQFLLQMTAFLKSRGITSYFNYLSAGNFGAAKGQLLGAFETSAMRLSSVTDGIILLLYVERGQKIKKMLTVLKLRGSVHDKDIYQYEICKGGINLGEKFED